MNILPTRPPSGARARRAASAAPVCRRAARPTASANFRTIPAGRPRRGRRQGWQSRRTWQAART